MLGRRVTGLVTLACALTIIAVVQDDVVRGTRSLFAPAYDTVTCTSLHNLATALQSYALLEGDLTNVTVPELATWGWEPSGDTQVTIWVSGDQFRVVAQDVRPGAGTFEVTGSGEVPVTFHEIDGAQAAASSGPAEAGVVIQVSNAGTI